MKTLLSIIIAVFILSCDTSSTAYPAPTPIVETPKLADSLPHYYVADYWVDCAGISVSNVTVKAPNAITKEWSRESNAGGYFKIKESTIDSVYSYVTDGTQNEHCGY